MGGIVGKLSFEALEPIARDTMSRMSDAIAHRGPSSHGSWFAPGIALAWRAFHDEAVDPMQVAANEAETVRAVADADFANAAELRRQLQRQGHRFRGESDAEVLAHAFEQWGEACVERFCGPFACAIWDEAERKLLLARDHLGIRPLFFALLHGHGVVFGSEIKAILEDQSIARQWSPEAVDAYLTLGYVPAPLTAYRQISKLEASHALVVEGRRLRMRQYWDFSFDVIERRGDADTLHALEARMHTAIRSQSGDGRAVGALHSGGTASATLLSVLPQAAGSAIAVSVGIEQEPAELVRVGAVSRHFGCAADVDVATPDVETVAPAIAWHLDEPYGDPLAIAHYSTFIAARRHMDVALTGHGAAALWAGYARHRIERVESSVRSIFGDSLSAISGHLAHSLEESVKGARAVSHLSLPPAGACATKHAYGWFDDECRFEVYTRGFAWQVRDANPLGRHIDWYSRCQSDDPLTRALYVEARTFLADNTLTIADRTSLAAAMRLRMPYLDRDLVEFAATVPSAFKQQGRTGMYALRQLLARRLPAALMPPARRAPAVRPWLTHALATLVPRVILDERFDNRGIFSRPALRRLWEEHQAGRRDHTHRLWSLLMLEFWFREFVDGDAAARPVEYAILRAA